ncbi:MAG: DUF3459 domain-containing protein, partial [Comamonadaceae bacterium]
ATHADAQVPLAALVNFLGNHDQVGNRAFGERLSALVPEPAAELALLLVLLTPSAPMVFMGDEFGATTPFLYFANWEGELRDAVRAGRQREFSHEASDAHPLPDPCHAMTRSASRLDWVQSELPAGRERSALVQLALDIRRQYFEPHAPALLAGAHTAERAGQRGLRIGWSYGGGRQIWLEANLGPDTLPSAPASPAGTVIFQHRWAQAQPGQTPSWAPWSAQWTFTDTTA